MPTDNFVDSFEIAQHIVNEAIRAHYRYWKMIEVCERHIKGEKPKDQRDLKKSGMAYANNWNYNKARGKVTKDVAENISRLKDAIYLNTPQFRRPKESDDADMQWLESEEDRGIISMKISRVFSETLFSENRFGDYLNRIEYPAYCFGFCAIVFDGMDDWLGCPTHPRDIAFEDKTRPNNVQIFVTFDTIKAVDLWDKWVNAHNAKVAYTVEDGAQSESDITTTNWSADGLAAVLWNALAAELKKGEDGKGTYSDWDEVVQSFPHQSSNLIQNTRNVTIAKIYYKELNKSWTETYIPYNNTWQPQHAKGKNVVYQSGNTRGFAQDKIIYQRSISKRPQNDIITLVKDSGFAEIGYIAELRGLAKFAVEDSIRFNRKKNNIEDKLIFSGSPMFLKPNTQTGEQFKIVPSQGFTLVQQGFDLLPDQPTFDLSQHIASIQFDEAHYQRETVQYNPSLQGRLTSRPVKDEVQGVAQELGRTRAAKNDVKILDYSALFYQVLMNLATLPQPDKDDEGYAGYKYFWDELEYEMKDYIPQDGNSKEYLKGVLKAIVGMTIEEFAGDEQTLQMGISLSETSFARNRLKRMLLVTQGIPRKEIDQIAPLSADSFRNLRDERIAAIENDMAMSTSDIVIDAEDDHIDHLNIHFKKFRQVIEGVQRGGIDPLTAFKWMANLMIHANLHIQMLSQDPTLQRQYKAMQEVFSEFLRVLGQLRQTAERYQRDRQAQASQPQMTEKERREIQIKEIESQQKMKRTNQLTINQARAKELDQAHRHDMEERDQAHRHALERLETENEIQLDRIKTAASGLN